MLGRVFSRRPFHSVAVFGGGLILSIVLAPVIGIKAVVPVIAVSLLVSHAQAGCGRFAVGFTWHGLPRSDDHGLPRHHRRGRGLFLPADQRHRGMLMGVFLICMVPLRRLMLRPQCQRRQAHHHGHVGVPFGVLSGSTVGAGLILAPFMLAVGLAGEALMGTMAAVALTVNVTKAAVFGGFAVLDPGLAVAGFLIGLCTIPRQSHRPLDRAADGDPGPYLWWWRR